MGYSFEVTMIIPYCFQPICLSVCYAYLVFRIRSSSMKLDNLTHIDKHMVECTVFHKHNFYRSYLYVILTQILCISGIIYNFSILP